MRPCFFIQPAYCASGAIADIGHSAAHVPHEMHFAGSMTHLPSAAVDIAITGHAPIHVWQPIHFAGSILYAIIILLNFNVLNRG